MCVFILLSCSVNNNNWKSPGDVIERLHGKEVDISDISIEKINVDGDKVQYDKLEFSIGSNNSIKPAGFIIVFKDEKEAKIFHDTSNLVFNNANSKNQYLLILNRNAIIFIDKRLPEKDLQNLADKFQSINP